MLETYKHKISGPILDRIDLWLPVPHVDYETLTTKTAETTGETERAREQIQRARDIQANRFKGLGIATNAEMTSRDINEHIEISENVKVLLRNSAEKLKLSPRSYHRLIKVAQTIADLDQKKHIAESHVLEALQYRVKL
jgi:magnesium chelatase family protein